MTYTPWGASDRADRLATGVMDYGTPSHGGIHLSLARRRELACAIGDPTAAEPSDGRAPLPVWYEEDCDWSIPFAFLPDLATAHGAEHVPQTLGHWHPDLFARMYGQAPERSAYDGRTEHWTLDSHRRECVPCAIVSGTQAVR